jgi:hypothetical protein
MKHSEEDVLKLHLPVLVNASIDHSLLAIHTIMPIIVFITGAATSGFCKACAEKICLPCRMIYP